MKNHGFRLGLLPLVALSVLACPIGTNGQGSPSAQPSVAGYYYFKGPRILAVQVQGDQVSTEFLEEADDLKALQESFPQSQRSAQPAAHRGKLASPWVVSFAGFPLTAQNLEAAAGMPLGAIPNMDSTAIGRLVAGTGGTYEERWTFAPGGKITVESTLPIFIPAIGDHTPEQAQLLARMKENGLSSVMGKYQRVCGWKLSDDREMEGWKALRAGEYAKAAEMFTAVAAAQRENPFACIGAAYGLTGQKEFEKARQAVEGARSRLTDDTRPFVTHTLVYMSEQIYTYETLALGQDAIALLKGVGAILTPQEVSQTKFVSKKFREISPAELQVAGAVTSRIQAWPKLESAARLRGRGPALPLGQQAFSVVSAAGAEIPNFLHSRMLGDALVLRGHYCRASGAQFLVQAVQQYGLSVCIGQKFRHGLLIGNLVGLDIERRGIEGFEAVLEDGAVKDPAVLDAMARSIDFLVAEEPPPDLMAMMAYDLKAPISSNPLFDMLIGISSAPNYDEAVKRAKAIRARLLLLSMGVRVKQQALKTGAFPDTCPPDSTPSDPFAATGTPLRYRKEGSGAILYSVGPDGIDGGGTTSFDFKDPLTPGDVILRIQ